MSNDTFDLSLCSPPDREKLVASISFDGVEWAELNQEGSELRVEFYPRPDGKAWDIPLAVAEAALRRAKQRLTGRVDPSCASNRHNGSGTV